MTIVRHTGRRPVDVVDVMEALDIKNPGWDDDGVECCFLARGMESCHRPATHAVVEHRKTKDVVMPGCEIHAATFAEDDGNNLYSVIPFVDLAEDDL